MTIDEYQQLVLLTRQHDQPLRGKPVSPRPGTHLERNATMTGAIS
jgi:hypothetical protein